MHVDNLYVLGDYWLPDRAVRSEIGELVYCAKEQANAGAADRLAERFAALSDVLRNSRPGASSAANQLIAAVPSRKLSPIDEPCFQLSDVLARALADAGSGLYVPDAVICQDMKQQMRNIPPSLRPDVAAQAGFKIRHMVAGNSLVLVDDVILTGATISEIARRLKIAGATRIDAVVAARTRLAR